MLSNFPAVAVEQARYVVAKRNTVCVPYIRLVPRYIRIVRTYLSFISILRNFTLELRQTWRGFANIK